jgi:DNA-binding transcriptional LysR family regulator
VRTLQAGAGIGELPSIVRPELMRDGRLVEVMPKWRLKTLNLSMVHLGQPVHPATGTHVQEFAAQMARKLFPKLPA